MEKRLYLTFFSYFKPFQFLEWTVFDGSEFLKTYRIQSSKNFFFLLEDQGIDNSPFDLRAVLQHGKQVDTCTRG